MSGPSLVHFSSISQGVQQGPFALPYSSSPYSMALGEVYHLFVEQAPFRSERDFLFEAMHHYLKLIVKTFPTATFWLNGGFTTWKEWAAPGDVDIVVILDEADLIKAVQTEGGLQLWTLQIVASEQPWVRNLPRVQPYGGLVDSFPMPDDIQALGIWFDTWSTVKGPDGNIIDGVRKGFVEVTADEII